MHLIKSNAKNNIVEVFGKIHSHSSEQFLTQNPNSKGTHIINKNPTHASKALFCQPFWKIGGLPIGPEWTDLSTSANKNSGLKGGPFYEQKLPTPVFGSLQCKLFRANEGVSQSAQIGPILSFHNIFLYKVKT